ncbi:MAG: hypoxanthine phosphoribosyltransferase [Planctomycetes bacterium]|nr:hypoxanthine phosphoribosyltransferase [Planctomycetota bacterium]
MTELYPVVFSSEQIQSRVSELAARISADYAGRRLMCLVVLRGGFFFAADLIRQLKGVSVELEFIKLESYVGQTSSGRLRFHGQLPRISGYEVLVIEDLVDTGLTLANLHEAVKAQGPRSLRYAIVVDKKARRKIPFECEYVCFDVEADKFLVGYGMDDNNKGRTLPYIGEVK